jgi:DNA-binding transcriptional MerR regulator
MSTLQTFTIGPVTTLTDTSPSTLRQWERDGLIPKPARSADGRRQYTPEEIGLIRDIARQRRRGRQPASSGGE